MTVVFTKLMFSFTKKEIIMPIIKKSIPINENAFEKINQLYGGLRAEGLCAGATLVD